MAAQQKLSYATEAGPWIFRDFSLDIPDVKSHLLPVDLEADDQNTVLYEAQGTLNLPGLESFQYGPLETISAEVESIHLESENDGEEVDDTDIWASIDSKIPAISRRTRTWEEFYDKDFSEPTIFLSEANEAVWNAVWKRFEQIDPAATDNVAIRRDYVVQCLIDLGLGLQSTLFAFDAAGLAHARDEISFSGISQSLTLDIVKLIGNCGESIRGIEGFIQKIRSNPRSSRSLTAATGAIDRIVNFTRQHIVEQSSKVTTILQVQALFRLPDMLLSKLRTAIKTMLACKDDVTAVNSMIELVEKHEAIDEWFRPLVLQTLVLTIQPFLDQVSQCIGLLPMEPSSQSSNTLLHELLRLEVSSTDVTLVLSKLSNLFDETQKHSIFAIYQSLNLLKIHQPEHNLFYPKNWSLADNAGLKLAVTWDDIEQIYKKVGDIVIETDTSSRELDPVSIDQIEQAEETQILDFNPYGLDTTSLLQNMLRSVQILNSTNASQDDYQTDYLLRVTHDVLHTEFDAPNHSVLQPPFEMLKIESFSPLLSAQSRAINRACLNMVFKDHDLLHNLDVLHELHLLGSGIFTTRLKEALFSAELSSAERKKGYHRAGQLGLRLGSRSTWPPASAELRLALMGILAECYRVSFPDIDLGSSDDLPGGLAFAIRNLPEPEIEACMDPQSLAALDFLRLQYQPPKALGSVISESALEKYDQIFRLLLRLSRVSFAVNQMWLLQRSSRHNPNHTMTKYTHQVHHFISELTTYIYTSIATTWTHFRSIISTIETQLDKPNSTISLFQLSALHDLMLDKITSDLLLRHRHEKARLSLDQILTSILQLAFASNAQHAQVAFSNFRSQVKLFISICRHFIDRGSHAQQASLLLPAEVRIAWDAGTRSMEGLQSLLLGLDFNETYSAK